MKRKQWTARLALFGAVALGCVALPVLGEAPPPQKTKSSIPQAPILQLDQQPPAKAPVASTDAVQQQTTQAGAAVYVDDAKIDSVTPSALISGRPMMVTLQVKLATPIPQSELIPTLKVFVDSVEAEPQDSTTQTVAAPAMDLRAREAGPTTQPAMRDTVGITLFAVAPDELSVGRDLTLSVYSTLDSREIAAMTVTAAAGATLGARLLASPSGQVLLLGVVALAVGAVWLALRQRRMTREQIRKLESVVQVERRRVSELGRSSVADDGLTSLGARASPPELPEAVMAALQARDLVLVLGPGVSAQSGLPTSRSLWLNVLDRYATEIPASQLEGLRTLITTEGTDSAIEPIVSLVGRDAVLMAVRDDLIGAGARPSRFHELLASLPVPAVLDTNWDDLMARALTGQAVQTFGPARPDGISEALRTGQLALLKPFGDLRQPESVVLTEREYRRALSQAPELERSIAALFSTRTLLFFGFSLRGLEQFLTSLPAQLESAGRTHFAVIPASSGMDLWQAGLGRRYGVTLVDFQPSADYQELVVTAETLAARVPEGSGDPGTADGRMSLNASRLTYLRLKSIGIFRQLEVEFTPGWTLLLGNNGGGKSTILRAVALALAGNDPRAAPAARRLLRTGEDSGSVELGIGSTHIVSNLVRDGQTVLVKSPQTTVLQAGQILALAFPALRGVNTTQVRGPTNMPAADPSVDDIAPLLEGAIDGRLDDLKQWVVNTALRAEDDPSGREANMLQTFERLIADMVPGGGLEFARVDRKTWQVMLKDEYGDVPFEGVSQGMSSILNWIGVLLQRLYDVYPRSKTPENEPGIVLIDEIDAHLHPEWQRRLVALTRDHFPNVQIIASSHSPLLAGAVERAELRVVAKDEDSGEIRAEVPREDVSGQKAEDILISSLFSLQTTRSVEAEEVIRRYFMLFQKEPSDLSSNERTDLAALELRLRELNYGPTSVERAQMERSRNQVNVDLASVSPDTAQALKDRLTAGLPSADAVAVPGKGTET